MAGICPESETALSESGLMKQTASSSSIAYPFGIKPPWVAQTVADLIWTVALLIPSFNIVFLTKTREPVILYFNFYTPRHGMIMRLGLISVKMTAAFPMQELAYIFGIARAIQINFPIVFFTTIPFIIQREP